MAKYELSEQLEVSVRDLINFRENLEKNPQETLEIDKLINLLENIIETSKETNDSDINILANTAWDFAFTMMVTTPSSLTWPIAVKISELFSCIKSRFIPLRTLLDIESIRKAALEFDKEPLIPKAFATLVIGMVSQGYLPISDLEERSLALLHINWNKGELLFIEKCLVEIQAMLAEKMASETEVQMMIDWIAETVRAMVADVDG